MTKNYEICLRLSVEEKERLERSARACGLSKTAYLRRLILEKEVKALPSQEIKALRTEVHKIGVNINQIARSVNAGIARAEDARRGPVSYTHLDVYKRQVFQHGGSRAPALRRGRQGPAVLDPLPFSYRLSAPQFLKFKIEIIVLFLFSFSRE